MPDTLNLIVPLLLIATSGVLIALVRRERRRPDLTDYATIPVHDASGFPPSGTIRVDDTLLEYRKVFLAQAEMTQAAADAFLGPDNFVLDYSLPMRCAREGRRSA